MGASATLLVSLLFALGSARAQLGAALSLNHFGQRENTGPAASAFNWTSISPSNDLLNMTDCYDGLKCGRLRVPLDYAAKGSPNITIAVSVFPATNRKPGEYKGIVLYNPGGPGGSGTEAIQSYGSALAATVGPGYDVVGFDPRGVGNSWPLANCLGAKEWDEFTASTVTSFDRRQDVALFLAQSELFAGNCLSKMGGTGEQKPGGSVKEWGPGYYFESGSVVNDMVRIATALGQDRLSYFGISYGTALGQYLVAMYPEKVDLAYIDSVLDAEPYRNGRLIETYEDTDEIIDAFFQLCTKAGRDVCPMAQATPALTAHRVKRMIALLDEDPLVVLPHVDGTGIVITASAVRSLAISLMYSPFSQFPELAQTLYAIEQRNVSALFEFGKKEKGEALMAQAYPTIMCSDMADLRNTSLNTAVHWTKQAESAAEFVDDAVSADQLQCIPWKLRPRNAFTGSFKPDESKWKGKMLIVNNLYDPVTPLSHARNVQRRTPNSSLLVQRGIGHSPWGTPGNCVDEVVQTFFATGELPEDSERNCLPTELPLIGEVDGSFSL